MFSTHQGLKAIWILPLFCNTCDYKLHGLFLPHASDSKLHELFLYLQATGGQREPSALRQRPSFERHHW
jgi:hypothetical protein